MYIRMNNNINQTESGYHQYDMSNGCCAALLSFLLVILTRTPNTPIESKQYLSVFFEGLFLLTPPCAYFQALSIGEASFLEQVTYHGSPPPVPFVPALAAGFHEHGLHALYHLNDS